MNRNAPKSRGWHRPKSMTKAFRSILALSCASLFLTSCTPQQMGKIVATVFAEALVDLAAQKVVALATHNDASIAMASAQVTAKFRYESPQTKQFIEKWHSAGSEVELLRKRFDAASDASVRFVDSLNEKAATIGNTALRERSQGLIDRKTEDYQTALASTDKAIGALESSVSAGRDIITALEIAGALGGFDDQIVDLQTQTDEMLDRLPEMGRMIEQGMALVDLEFGALEQEG